MCMVGSRWHARYMMAVLKERYVILLDPLLLSASNTTAPYKANRIPIVNHGIVVRHVSKPTESNV